MIVIGLATVSEHVERVRIGYELRRFEQEHRRLVEERKARRLIWERYAAIERIGERAVALGVVSETTLRELLPDAEAVRQRRKR